MLGGALWPPEGGTCLVGGARLAMPQWQPHPVGHSGSPRAPQPLSPTRAHTASGRHGRTHRTPTRRRARAARRWSTAAPAAQPRAAPLRCWRGKPAALAPEPAFGLARRARAAARPPPRSQTRPRSRSRAESRAGHTTCCSACLAGRVADVSRTVSTVVAQTARFFRLALRATRSNLGGTDRTMTDVRNLREHL